MEFIGLVWLGSSILCAIIGMALASEKGRSGAGFLLGLILGPIGIVIALLLPAAASGKSHNLDSAAIADLNAITQSKGRVGLKISASDHRTITEVSPNSSASNAGIKIGDRLVMIDEALCEGDFRSVMLRLVGEKGTTVKISVRRRESLLEFSLLRR